MDLRLATLGGVLCKHFASYQGYPNCKWDLIWYANGQRVHQINAVRILGLQWAKVSYQTRDTMCGQYAKLFNIHAGVKM
jgi:hypothetical protein